VFLLKCLLKAIWTLLKIEFCSVIAGNFMLGFCSSHLKIFIVFHCRLWIFTLIPFTFRTKTSKEEHQNKETNNSTNRYSSLTRGHSTITWRRAAGIWGVIEGAIGWCFIYIWTWTIIMRVTTIWAATALKLTLSG
jgi:hypothetical protein